MKAVLSILMILGSLSAFAVEKTCEDSVADWLVTYHSAETRSKMINKFCSNFRGNPNDIRSCLQGAWTWVEEITESGKRYDVAFTACSQVNSRNAASEVSRCLTKHWDANTQIQDRNERRKYAAVACSSEI
jgi:hypothetical protein